MVGCIHHGFRIRGNATLLNVMLVASMIGSLILSTWSFRNTTGNDCGFLLPKETLLSSSSSSSSIWTTTSMTLVEQTNHRPSSIDSNKAAAAICAIAIQEEPYLIEWTDYHLGLGFDHIYIYDNSDHFILETWPNETNREDRVSVIHIPGPSQQKAAYLVCKYHNRRRHQWLAFFDVDEFLVLKKHDHVTDMLNEHLTNGSLAINWVFFGTANQSTYSPLPVTKRFRYIERGGWGSTDYPFVNPHIKSIVVRQDMANKLPHAHYPKLKRGIPHDTNGNRVDGPLNPDGPADVAVLYHYHYKSRSEYIAKRLRGYADHSVSQETLQSEVESLALSSLPAGDVYDDTAWKLLKRNVPKYAGT